MKLLKKFLFSTSQSCCWAADLGDLVLRVVPGLIMSLGHGKAKLPPPEMLITGVGSLGFRPPTLFAWLAALSEFLGGLLLASGLLTRVGGLMIASTMSVAAFMAHRNDPIVSAGGPAKEMALLYLSIGFMYMLKGAGRLSVDRIIEGSKGAEPSPSSTNSPPIS